MTRVSPEQGGVGPAAPGDTNRWVSAEIDTTFLTSIRVRTHVFAADEPGPLGGMDKAPTPYELLLGSLSSCMAMTMRMYANRKGWPLEGARIDLRTAPARDADREVRVNGARSVTRIERRIELMGPLSEEQRARLVYIADRCPVKRNLESGLAIIPATDEP